MGRLRFGTQVCRFQDFVLYRAIDEVKRRDVLVRQYAPEEPEKAMSGLPAAGRHAKSRWDQLLDIQLQRFELARKSLPSASPYHVSLVDHLLDDTFYAILTHPAVETLSADFADIKSPSEPALHQLLLPIMEVLSGLHKNRVLYCGLGPEEILLDRTDPGSLGVPVLAGFGSVYHWGGMGQPRPRADDRPSWAPECYDRQAPLTAAADVYALGALTYQLMTGAPPAPAARASRGTSIPRSQISRRAIPRASGAPSSRRSPSIPKRASRASRPSANSHCRRLPPRPQSLRRPLGVRRRRPLRRPCAARQSPTGPAIGAQIGAPSPRNRVRSSQPSRARSRTSDRAPPSWHRSARPHGPGRPCPTSSPRSTRRVRVSPRRSTGCARPRPQSQARKGPLRRRPVRRPRAKRPRQRRSRRRVSRSRLKLPRG
ncbi:MAG: hypothetical protein U1E87_07910 [Alphaproteobacteria bacterium]